MAVFVFTNAKVQIAPTTGGTKVDLSDHVTSVTVTYEKDSIETTAMGATGHVFTGGLQNLSVALELNNDQATGSVLETLWSNTGTGTSELTISNTTTVGDQKFTIVNAFLSSSTPVNGAVGDLSKQSVTFTGGSITKGTV
ncbi:hypothetical protein UFOVP227_19 [uncultured Caudovirales phage]|uniref:Uncharacterized protein n=1 Tax=uncultured Caudovirales phage TaxID=2100421 RepID=A0A6J7WSD5_9CAUD|nr:hypothetical protein UFOVP227_19 [uncultured Caudovirales phage]